VVDLDRLSEALGAEEVAVAYLFGSAASGTMRRDSDVDVAVIFREDTSPERRFELRCALSERAAPAAGVDRVDVVDLEAAPPLLAHEILAKGRLLFSRDERRRVLVTARQTMRYIDWKPMQRVLDDATFRRIREGTFGRLP
jgi:predicted nucleotidyltransferase